MVSEGASRLGLAPKTRRLPDWLIVAFFGLYGLAVLMILGRRSPAGRRDGRLRASVPLANVAAGDHGRGRRRPLRRGQGRTATARATRRRPPSLDDHQPAVGLGRPINRTLWTLIWGVAAMIFQVMGIVYMLGDEVFMPQFVRDADRLRRRPDHVLRRRDARLHRR